MQTASSVKHASIVSAWPAVQAREAFEGRLYRSLAASEAASEATLLAWLKEMQVCIKIIVTCRAYRVYEMYTRLARLREMQVQRVCL